MAQVWIKELTFNDGTSVSLAKNDIVILVGPNNAGKSATLRESAQLLRVKSQKGKVVSEISIGWEGNEDQLIQRLNSLGNKVYSGNPLPSYQGYGFDIYEANAKSYWSRINHEGLSELQSIFVKNVTTEERLSAANPTHNIKLSIEPPTHPIHFLQKKDSLEAQFSTYFRMAFGTDLIVHRNAGSEVPLYVGDRPIPKQGEDRVSEGYLAELETRDLLHQQGDGMRSFVGVLLSAFVSQHSILFIDEPEAFLHPPQARQLGAMLARDLPAERQLFLSTHSQDFLKGVLDSKVRQLKIIRIRRDGSINPVRVLNSADIESIWNDSLLRHSNILDGLFHSKVVICESDSDCRFYSAVLNAIYDGQGVIAPDVMFVHCGGKHRIATVARALKKLGVPLTVVADFDVLADEQPLRAIVEELEGNWLDLEADWRLVKNSVDQKRPELETEDVKKEIESILANVGQRIFPQDAVRDLNKVLKRTSAWSLAKSVGKPFVPSGNPTQAYNRLQKTLKTLGLLIVEVGELEGFVRSIGNHGPKWVNEAMNLDLKNDVELDAARRFVAEMV